jgi:aryl-alcohol dehydrogenase-like predicted oxidoreductase
MYQGQEWERNQAFVEILRTIAGESGRSVAEVVLEWTFSQPGITSVLCGAKRRWQLAESAAAMRGQLSAAQLQQINLAIEQRGKAETRRLFQ